MKRLIITIIGILLYATAFSQSENVMWAKIDTISTEIYEFQVPLSWRNFEKMLTNKNGPEQFFEASGKGLPISFNGSPVIISIFLVKINEAESLEDAKKSIIEGYFENPDRVFEKKRKYSEGSFNLSDGHEAIILNTRFYRKSKGLNQSRYDLITYSDKNKIAYMFTVSIQYFDKTYAFENSHNLMDYANNLYRTFNWK